MNRLQDKVAMITGASGGIGAVVAQVFAAEGARLVMTDRAPEPGRSIARALGDRARFVEHDATSESDWHRVLAFARDTFGRLDVLVNAVGSGTPGPIDVETYEHWQLLMRLNADTAFLGCRHGIPLLAATGGGSVINFCSTMGVRPRPETPAYSASKAAVRALTQSAAQRCGELKNGVRVNCVVPGSIETPMVNTMIDGLVANAVIPDRQAGIAMFAAAHPIGRMGQPMDIAHALVFLASDESGFVTGSSLAVDGGYTAA